MRYCFGVDIGGTTVKMGLFEAAGEILDKWEIKTRTENNGSAILPDVAEAILKKVEEHKLNKEDIVGVGVGVPAPATEEGFVYKSANLGWENKDVKKELEELTGFKAEIGNDANVAALGEMWKGGGAGYKNLVMVTLGTGVGGGIISNGKILVGSHGAGGEIGHLLVNPHEQDTCGCGRKGCLEQYASATGIVRLAKRKLQNETRSTSLDVEAISAKSIFDAVKEGDIVAQEIAKEFGRYLGNALSNIAVITDPSIFVIGGGVSKAGEILLDYIKAPYQERAFFANEDVKFALATLGNDAGICGAAKLVLDDLAD
ncbi:MAG: ROK family glucokinase [Candidatus Ruminococcus intestinipullorum]|nr:ROK family glucokinase [Candidatus Ruminococcus intestinipullorum]